MSDSAKTTSEAVVRRTASVSTYDLFGYLIPGATLLCCIIALEESLRGLLPAQSPRPRSLTPLLSILELFHAPVKLHGAAQSAVIVTIWLGASYIIGHIVASISAFAVDRGLIAKGVGYPSQRLMFPEDTADDLLSRRFWRTLFTFMNVALLAAYADRVLPSVVPELDWRLAGCAWRISLWILAIALGLQTIATAVHEWECRYRDNVDRVCSLILCLPSLPFDLAAWLCARFVHTALPFDKTFRESIQDRFLKTFGIEAKAHDTNVYWLPAIFIRSRSDALDATLASWLNLYSFSRNLSTALWLAAVYAGLLVSTSPQAVNALSQPGEAVLALLPPIFFVASIVVLFRYYYLYAEYYTRYLLRAFFYLAGPGAKSALVPSDLDSAD